MPRRTDGATAQQQPQKRTLTAQQCAELGRRAAFARIHRHGTDGLRDQLRRGFWGKFEKQVDAQRPDLRTSDPAAFQRCVQAALQRHMQQLSAKSLASRAAKRAAKTAAAPPAPSAQSLGGNHDEF
jgi:hypothetical protein